MMRFSVFKGLRLPLLREFGRLRQNERTEILGSPLTCVPLAWQPSRAPPPTNSKMGVPSPTSVVPVPEEVVGYDELRLRVREQGQHAVALAKVQALAKV